MNAFMLAVRMLFTFTWLVPLVLVGVTIGLVVVPIYHGMIMVYDTIKSPRQINRHETEHE
jgi:hypothetical protein